LKIVRCVIIHPFSYGEGNAMGDRFNQTQFPFVQVRVSIAKLT